jgi:hypothetical protein
MGDDGELHYPNLASCRVTLKGSAASSTPPVTLPSDCLNAVKMALPDSPYDFSLGTLRRKERIDARFVQNVCCYAVELTDSQSHLLFFCLFTLERNVLKRKEDMEHDEMLMKATSREELQQATLTKMKSVTGAEEDVCVAMLESNGYDLTTSIETFYIKK